MKKYSFLLVIGFIFNIFPYEAIGSDQEPVSVAEEKPKPFIEKIKIVTENIAKKYDEVVASLKGFPLNINRIFLNLTDLEGYPKLQYGIEILLGLGIVGYFVSYIASLPLYRGYAKSRPDQFIYFSNQLIFNFVYLVINGFQIILFTLTIFAGSLLFFDRFDPMRLLVTTFFLICIITWGSSCLFRFIANIGSKHNAVKLRKHPFFFYAILIIFLACFANLTSGLLKILGLLDNFILLWNIGSGFGIILLIAILFFRYHIPVIHAYLGLEALERQNTNFDKRKFIEHSLPMLMLFSLMMIWLSWSLNLLLEHVTEAKFAYCSLFFLIFIPLINHIMERIYLIFWPHRDNARKVTYIMQCISSWLLIVMFIIFFLESLHISIINLLMSANGLMIFKAILSIGITIAISYMIWLSTKHSIQTYLSKEREKMEAEHETIAVGENGEPIIVKTRAETLLPLFQMTIFILLIAVTMMVILSSIGIDIGPLLAGAGVVGLAIGFGAQALVRDIVAGIFFLVDDAFRVGEYVEIGEIRGEVEKISLRSMQLRHHKGAVHTLPFGELKSITNYNRDWAIYKQNFRIPYSADIDKIRKIIKKIGKELLKDPELGPKFIQPLKSQGVKLMEDSAMILGTKFMCKPREQFYLRRIIFQRIQEEFANAGIEFARRQVQVALPENHHLDEKDILTAATDELEEEQVPKKNSDRL